MNLVTGTFFNAAILGIATVILGTLLGRFHPLLDLFAHFLLPATVSALVMALLAVLAGRTPTMLIFVGLALLMTALLWPWTRQPASVPATGPRFTLMTFNVYYNNPRLERVAELIRETKPDIVVLLEVVPRVRPALDAVADQYPYRVESWQHQWGDALVLSRFPLTDVQTSLPEAKFRRPMGAVEVAIEGRKLTLLPTHLSLPYPLNGREMQTGEIKEVVTTVAGINGPRILLGDFNASPWATTMALPQTELSMTLLTGGDGSWPTFLPRAMGIPIDHILATPEFALKSRKLFTVSGSDHRAVLAEVAFKE
jgi:endonuclease/exonuclease/phosphatase (EEP) superfamily protein YafD